MSIMIIMWFHQKGDLLKGGLCIGLGVLTWYREVDIQKADDEVGICGVYLGVVLCVSLAALIQSCVGGQSVK